ncbi:hypothetical protein [Lactobacillus amylolyticus]|uniref:hypothetical protein n=1 Tax=Lactobacillus amylolyticus TaxID=83683 RepID=UPI000FCAE7F0|nr:hypothetical protein [Lactobacillus amylolyticus]
MTKFWTLFRELFKQKSKPAYIVFLIQVAVALVTLFITATTTPNFKSAQMFGNKIPWLPAWILMYIVIFLMYSFIADFAYLLLTAWKNEKINCSQTWRLVPMSYGKIYLCNTLSSFCSFIYLVIMQSIVGLIGCLIAYASSNGIRKAIAYALHQEAVVDHWADVNIGDFLVLILFMILLGLFWYVIISFLHFTSRAIVDFLPMMSNKFIVFVIRAIVLIVIVYSVIWAMNMFGEIYSNPWFFKDSSFASSFMPETIELLIFDLIFGAANYALIDKFVEAKQNN